MTTKLTSIQLQGNLDRFFGSETWFSHSLNRFMHYTEGVQYFAQNAGGQGAYWLLDIIATELFQLQKAEPFIKISITVRDNKAAISGDDGDGNVIYLKLIDYTDLQEGTWNFYLTDNVLLLPSEY
jgi:hypothetical protein